MLSAIGATLLPFPVAVTWRGVFRIFGWRYDFYFGWGCSGLGGAIGSAMGHDWLSAGGSAANALVAAFFWWLSRRRRKRAPRALGAKSRALLAAVVRTMRERSRVRPALRPVPGRAAA